MVSRTVVLLVCDLCNRDSQEVEGIETHRVAVDGQAFEAEACLECWARSVKALEPLAKQGRAVKKVKLQRGSFKPVK